MINILKKFGGFAVMSFCFMLGPASSAFATDYYISPEGDNGNSGTSPEEAWQTLERANLQHYQRGDSINLEAGETFEGPLVLNSSNYDSASSDDGNARLSITSFGGEATIEGEYGIVIQDAKLVAIKNLKFRGTDPQRGAGISMYNVDHFLIESVTAENFQNGIEFQAADQGANYKIHIKDVKVNNNGGGGMLFSGTNGTDCPAVSGIEGITIKNVTANGNRYGIGVSGAGRVIITGSKAAENSGEGSYGIAADCVKDFEITENSEVAYNSDSSGEGGIGIKVTRSQSGKIDQNMIYGNTIGSKLDQTDKILIAYNLFLYQEKSSLLLARGNTKAGIVQNTLVVSGEGADAGAAVEINPTNPLTARLHNNNLVVEEGDAPFIKIHRQANNGDVVFLRNNYSGDGKFLDQNQTFSSLADWSATGAEGDGLERYPGFDADYRPGPDFLAQSGIDFRQFAEEFETLSARPSRDVRGNLVSGNFTMGADHLPGSIIPPPPPPSGVIAQPSLTAGLATFGQVVPQGLARDGVKLGNLPTQTDIKTRWPDGSIRSAVVTANVPSAATYDLTAGPAGTGAFTPAFPPVSVELLNTMNSGTSTGANYTARFSQAEDYWLRGSLVTEARQVVTPVDSNGNPHPFLRVIFDVRAYNDGKARADVTVENVLDLAGATSVVYNVRIKNGSGTLFSKNSVFQPYLTRWREVFALNGLVESEVTPDFEPAYRAKALPRYLSLVTNWVSAPVGPDFEILGIGCLTSFMPEHGDRPCGELGSYPGFSVRYLVHKNPSQRAFVLAHGDLAGSWPVHVRETDGPLVSIDQRPSFWLEPRANNSNRPAGNFPGGTGPHIPDNAHQPSLAYIPYLITGDRYYADEMAFWANYVLLVTWQDDEYNARGGSQGLLHSNEVRGIAWGLRNIVDAAAYLPDSEPLKEYFAEKVRNNLVWLDNYAAGQNNPLSVLWAYKRPENIDPGTDRKAWIALWEQDFLAWAIDHANKQGFSGGLLHRDKIVRLQINLFSEQVFRDNDGAAPYILPVGDQVPSGSGNIRWYSNIRQTYPGPGQYPGYYGAYARWLLMIGIENAMAGAQEAYNYLWPKLAVEPYMDVPDLARRAECAIAPETTAASSESPPAA